MGLYMAVYNKQSHSTADSVPWCLLLQITIDPIKVLIISLITASHKHIIIQDHKVQWVSVHVHILMQDQQPTLSK